MTDTPEQPLLPSVAQGDQEAMRGLIDRYGGLVWSIARRLLWNESDVESAAQEVYAELWRCADRFDASKASEKTFVAMIARRRIIDKIRRQAARPERTSEHFDTIVGGTEAVAADDAVRSDDTRAAFEAFNALSPDQQQVLRLSIQHGRTHEEIAKALSMPLGTVKTHARRGMLRVRAMLEQREGVAS